MIFILVQLHFTFFVIRSLQVIDLTSVSPELAYMASDADLVVLEGMVRYPPFIFV